MTKYDIIDIFNLEFYSIKDRFLFPPVISVNDSENENSKKVSPYKKCGIYVFFNNDQPIKVGKNQENVLKRALCHIKDKTGEKSFKEDNMGQYSGSNTTFILFIIPKLQDDFFWLCSIEAYLEIELRKRDLKYKAFRIG